MIRLENLKSQEEEFSALKPMYIYQENIKDENLALGEMKVAWGDTKSHIVPYTDERYSERIISQKATFDELYTPCNSNPNGEAPSLSLGWLRHETDYMGEEHFTAHASKGPGKLDEEAMIDTYQEIVSSIDYKLK